jgi:hypothetical protein
LGHFVLFDFNEGLKAKGQRERERKEVGSREQRRVRWCMRVGWKERGEMTGDD